MIGRHSLRNDRLDSLLFFLPLGIWIAVHILNSTQYGAAIKSVVPLVQIDWACLAVLALREVLFGYYSKRSLVGLSLCACMALIAYHASFTTVYMGACFVFAARDVPFKRIVSFAFAETAALLLLVFLSAMLGVVDNIAINENSQFPRHALGFSHPNAFALYVFALACAWSYLRAESFGVADAAAILAITFASFTQTMSRSSLVCTVLIVICALVCRHLPPSARSKTTWSVVAPVVICAMAIASLALCICYDANVAWMAWLDNALSSRLSLAHDIFWDYGIAPFGQQVKLSGGPYYNWNAHEWVQGVELYTIDNSYMRLLVVCGPLFLAVGLVLACLAARTAALDEECLLVCAIIVWALYGIAEVTAAYAYANVFLFLLAKPFACNKASQPKRRLKAQTAELQATRSADDN